MDIGTHIPTPPSRLSPATEKLSLSASSTVYTYHCLCSHLLLATTTPLPLLPTRQNSLDKAHIMPLPPPPQPSATKSRAVPKAAAAPNDHYGLMLSTVLDAKPEVVRGDGGFEKRFLQRCGRCALVVGYQLDWAQFPASASCAEGEVAEAKAKEGRRDDVVYLLPGGFVTTAEMIMGKAAGKGKGMEVMGLTEVKA